MQRIKFLFSALFFILQWRACILWSTYLLCHLVKLWLSVFLFICLVIGLLRGNYTNFITKYYKSYFQKLVSYNRFVELMRYVALPMALFTKSSASYNPCTGISFADYTTLDVCDNHRIQQNKVFRGIAMRGKSSAGWFHGFKLHFVINEHGEILTKICLKIKGIFPKNCLRSFGKRMWNW